MRILLAAIMGGVLAGPAAAQDRPDTISTHATARTRLPNTVADVALGVEAHARTLAAVHQALTDGSGPLLAYLRGAGAERLRTEEVTVTPDTDNTGRGQPDRIVGYAGSMQVSFRVPAEKLSDVLGGALGKGANTVQSTLLVPRETEIDAAQTALAVTAVKSAIEQARMVAEAAGRRLGPVQNIAVAGMLPLRQPVFASRAMAAAPIATASGESETTVNVAVVVTLTGP